MKQEPNPLVQLTGDGTREVGAAMKIIWILVKTLYVCRINILPELRKQFPGLTWTFERIKSMEDEEEFVDTSEEDVSTEVQRSHFVWDLGEAFLFARYNEVTPKHRFGFHLLRGSIQHDNTQGPEWIHFMTTDDPILTPCGDILFDILCFSPKQDTPK